MKTARQPRNPQSDSSLERLGISLNPLEQLSGLVNLINASQAPQMQQQQFNDEMGLKRLLGDRQYEGQQNELALRGAAEQNNQYNADRTYDLQGQQYDQQERYQEGMLGSKRAALEAGAKGQQQDMLMDFARLGLNAASDQNGPGMIDMKTLQQVLASLGPGLQNLVNPKQRTQGGPVLDTSATNKDLNDDAFRQSLKKHTGQNYE